MLCYFMLWSVTMSRRNMMLLPLDRRVWAVPLTQKKHKESTVQAPIRSILCCRLCEGFLVKSIGLVTGSKGLSSCILFTSGFINTIVQRENKGSAHSITQQGHGLGCIACIWLQIVYNTEKGVCRWIRQGKARAMRKIKG